MKIDIGPYKSDIIPVYNWERRYEMWRSGELYLNKDNYTWYDKLILGFLDKLSDLVLPINYWSNRRKRKIKIHIDNYDIWSADHTLSMIILPVLIELKKHKHGSPIVDPEDVPEDLRPSDEPSGENGYVDDTHHERWDYVLNEMIWAFYQHRLEDDTDQFYHNREQLGMTFAPVEGTTLTQVKMNDQKDLTKPAYFRDDEGLKKHEERKANGRRLFAKYYEALWD